MKNKFLYGMVILLLTAMSVSTVQANDYLEQKEHYTVMNMGNGVYRFYVPIWVYGRINNYYLDASKDHNDANDSYIWYSLKKDQTRDSEDVHRIVTVAAVRAGKNVDEDYGGRGEGYIYVHEGSVIVQNMYDGEKVAIPTGDDTYYKSRSLVLKRKNDDGHEDITYFTFDWYVPQELAGKDFYVGVSAHIYKYSPNESYDTKWWPNNEKQNVSNPQTPELFAPYLYAMDGEGVTGYGNAAVQYTVFQEPVSYHTSFNATEMPVDERAGTIIVPTTDTVQRLFSATFRVDMTRDSAVQRYTIKSNEINIPAYHRIYDFRAEEVLDEQQSITGNVKLTWGIRCPGVEDLVSSDMFEVERAFKPDFSDAVTIAIESFNTNKGSYEIPDSPLDAMRALADTATSYTSYVSESGTFTVKNANGDQVEYEAVLSSSRVNEPGRPVYYRVRRATSAVWGWIEGFSQSTTLKKSNYLAPLASTQQAYTLDADYETNRKVHFRIKLDNQSINLEPEPEAQCVLQSTVKNIHRLVPITLRFTGTGGVNPADYRYKIFYLPPEGTLQSSFLPLENNEIHAYAESGGMVQVSVIGKHENMNITVYVVDLVGKLDDKAAYIADVELYPSGDGTNLYAHITEDEAAMQAEYDDFVAQCALPDTARHTLYTKLEQKVAKMNASTTRCNWDRNAILYLQRIHVESGDTIEIPVPADSIVRQADGSWMAHMTDIANRPCVHYKYAVRIDQKASALKAQRLSSLAPVAIDGPDLYYNEVADIARFDASQGDDRYGIIVTWSPTPGGVDYYELSRREAGSNAVFRPIQRTEGYGYRDNDVAPGVHYEYQIVASYTCNDSTTTHSATTTGFRSPYGLISGRIHYADGTGCPGVKVAVTGEGLPVTGLTTLTDGSGRYMFDSLLYGAGKDYSVIPTSTYAEFRFNNTSMTTASATLDATNPVAENIEFDNISSVRFSGRILYSMSSIPVRDANLLLDSVLIERSGGPLKTDAAGNFEIQVPLNHPFTLQAVKEGHTFEGDGFVRMNNDSNLVLTKPLDGVRIWDATKVRLAGRIVGGLIQADLPLGFGLSVNNLGDDLQLVLELEGDNISHIVRDENDLTRDTLEYAVPHLVYDVDGSTDTVGMTYMHYQKKRIIINPDPLTGEYCAELFPVRYKITQATAKGYATLFAEGKTSEVIDLSNAATVQKGDMQGSTFTRWNEKYSITYRSPIDITCTQMNYGLESPFLGEKSMTRQNIKNEMVDIPLAEKDSDGIVHYTFGHPVFATGDYTFRITAHEDYYYNNDKTSVKHEQVPINGGEVKVYNGLHASTETQTLSSLFPRWEQSTQHVLSSTLSFNEAGQMDITIPVDYASFNKTGDQALRVLDVSIDLDGRHIEKQVICAYVTGNHSKGNDYAMAVDAGVKLLDVLRDPPGAKSYAFLESGTSYTYNYNWTLGLEFGIKLDWSYGAGMGLVFGTYMGVTPGIPSIFTGHTYSTTATNGFSLPITQSLTWKHGGSYTFTTNERIETANDSWFVGSRGDVYLGVAQSAIFQLMDAVKPIDSLTYITLAAQLRDSVGVTGSSATVAEGHSLDGNPYYLVIGEEIAGGSQISGSFAYSQDYILTVLLPQLIEQRDALLVTGDSATVQAIADAKGEEVYWSQVLPTDTTFALTNYKPVYPTGVTPWMKVDRVEEYNKTILSWLGLIAQNEKEKIAVLSGLDADLIDTYFVSNGVKLSHTETYNAVENHAFKIDGLQFNPSSALTTLSITDQLDDLAVSAQEAFWDLVRLQFQEGTNNKLVSVFPTQIFNETPTAKISWTINPILDVDWDRDPNWSESRSRTAGFVLEPDEYSYMNVSVYRHKEEDNDFNKDTYDVRETVDDGWDYDDDQYLYGSYIYQLNGGATKCPWEGPEESIFYEQGGKPALLSNGTLKLENPKIDILNHTVSDIPHDQPAIIHILLSNETEQLFNNYVVFKLVLVDASNPNGAKVLMDGFPLTGDGRAIKLNPGQTIDKTLEVYAGQGYDFENLTLMLASTCDILNFQKASFSVHYQPTSCDVNISAPHDKWVMNTLSPKDSTGWYLPVVIDGYDINYPNFDHIEFQYKLTKQSDDGWVNLCSYYADSTLYEKASGSKAMMKPGRIENIAFYGERDPMEQQYDLRAVSFCRYGTSFLTKSSPVLTGIKDTRVPVVFGEPEPANSILGVGDHLKLRFNEPIAGNYLDEDNNFQITGITNETGLSASTALHFDGNAKAVTKAKRDLTDTDFTIDMMIRPTVANNRANDMILFETGDGQMTKQLILTKDNILRLVRSNGTNFLAKSSRKLEDIRAFTRVLCVYKKGGKTRFYLGTEEVTANSLGSTENAEEMQDRSAYFSFGNTYDGDMLETRIWTKALTLEQISATANHSLTGYERELLAYYRMDEGKGGTVTDHAHGATLYLDGCSWNKQKGYSLRMDGEPVQLNGNLLGRSAIYDETLMFWFKAEASGTLFRSAEQQWDVPEGYADGLWHHFTLTISRTYNNAALFLDGKMVRSFDATELPGITGAMYLGGNGFKGNIDEFVIFEQALPKSLVELYEDIALTGDEMGLFAYLPFEEQYTNPNGIIELRFSVNDRRVFKDANGKVINKIVPLVLGDGLSVMGDGTLNAPVKSNGVLNKLYFNWSFNNDELMINILNRDYEVNKQSIYVTVRDVEDLNGNPMASPVTWTAFVDRNSLKWSEKQLLVTNYENDQNDQNLLVRIINNSGKRHTYTIESLPSWLTVDTEYGAIDPMGEKNVRLTFNGQAPVGEYDDIIYLTDEDGLSEPLHITYTVEAIPPYDEVDGGQYPFNMSVCAQVMVEGAYVTDENDIVYAFCRNECVGMEHVSYDQLSNKSKVYLTVFGNNDMNRKPIRFQLWHASTGKLYDLSSDRDVLFSQSAVYGCDDGAPVMLTANGWERQVFELQPGWNWTSFYLNLQPHSAKLSTILTANDPWTEGDIIKNPATQHFVTYSDSLDNFVGQFGYLRYIYTYMMYCQQGNTMYVYGDTLPEDSMHILVSGGGQWSAIPCLFDQNTPINEALADYYQNATPGDLIKARNRFATFTEDKRWEGNLTALRPGEGYFFRRMAPGSVDIDFFKQSNSNAPKRAPLSTEGASPLSEASPFSNPNAATNMTMIAVVKDLTDLTDLKVFVNDELAAVATPLDSLFFLTIQSDQVGELRFEIDGQKLTPENGTINYSADTHHGSLKAPVVLRKDENAVYKILENDHVFILRNGERYDVTGRKVK